MSYEKTNVEDFWDRASCGEDLYLSSPTIEGYTAQANHRYTLEPYIMSFADFSSWGGKRILEVGVGLGADHQRFAEAGAHLWGVDLTEQALKHTRNRFALFNLKSELSIGDAELLNFEDDTFDLVYSWGVIHHTPNTSKAASEILRVLKPGGSFRVMIYNKHSIVGYMLWVRYGLMMGNPFRSLADIYANHLESPGTKAYTIEGARGLFSDVADVQITTVLTHSDLLEGKAGQKHEGLILALGRKIMPRALIKMILPRSGLFMMISGCKPE